MFYDGDLQSGISKAIQEQKLVACFVRQEGDEDSARWENEWLKDPLGIEAMGDTETSLGSLLGQKAILLRLEAGSQEAGFLSAFCSLDKTPKLVIISNGTVLEDLEGGVSKEDFRSRIMSRLKLDNETSAASQQSTSTAVGTLPQDSPSTPSAPLQSSQTPTSPPVQDNGRVQTLLAERSARLGKQRQIQEEADKEARKASAKARKDQEAKEASTSASGSVPKARQDWLQQQRTRQQEAKIERERVLRSIEADKEARRERERQRKLAAQSDVTAGAADQAGPSSQARQVPQTSQRGSSGTVPTHCALQIRLFDGTSLRSRFSASSTLSTAVRTYVSEQSETHIPYNFRQMQTPLPSRTIDITEENESLLSLGLCPSATLVLVPVKGYTEAYQVSGGTGVINQGINVGYHLLSGAYNMATGLVGRVTGYGGDATSDGPYVAGTGDETEPSNLQGSRMAEEPKQAGPPAGIKVRTLADQRREAEGTEFYNGNQLNTQPRKKDDDNDDV